MGGQPVTKTVKFEPIETVERLYVRVARRVADMVSSGQLAPGEKLPSERDLADLLNKGLLARRPGGGRSTSYEVRWD